MAKDTESIAIVGMAGRFPESPDLEDFWRNLCQGRECVHFYSDAEMVALGFDPPALRAAGHVAAVPRIEHPEMFDAEFFGISDDQAETIDPQQRLFLEVCWEAIENAGLDPLALPGRAGLFGGQGIGNYLLFNLAALMHSRPDRYFSTITANGPDFLCSRVAFACNLNGPCVTVQAACATGLVATHLATQSLLNFECDIALAGAVTLQLLPLPGYFYDGRSIYSADGHSRIFDQKASGTVFGDGCGVVVLKRYQDAIEAGDSIRAVIRGSAINNSGAIGAGFHTPNAKAQEQVAVEALEVAGVDPAAIGYIELHGSGSPIGDAIEVTAIARAYRSRSRGGRRCGIGAVKSNVGHLGGAAAMASLCKTVLALEHGEIPPSILVERVNEDLALEKTPFHLVTAAEPWPDNGCRMAAINSYGVGGTNAHLILEQAPVRPASPSASEPQLLVLSARTPKALTAMRLRLAACLQARDVNLADVAYTLATGRTRFRHREVFVCHDRHDAVTQLSGGAPATQKGSAAAGHPATLAALGRKWVEGGEVAWSEVFDTGRRRVPLPSYAFQRRPHWIGFHETGDKSAMITAGAEPPRHVPSPPMPAMADALAPTLLEATLCGVWRTVVGFNEPGVDDNFFALGGTSLQLASVHARLRDSVEPELTVVDVFMYPTPRTLAAQIERIRRDPATAGRSAGYAELGGLAPPAPRLLPGEVAMLRADARLADDIQPRQAPASAPPECILLTGATGFLGVFLLRELLAGTSATIYCHVRAANPTAGLERIRAAMQVRGLWTGDDARRIVAVPGDFDQPRLGISSGDFRMLAERIEAIVHNGAAVNFTPPYLSLKRANVDGTEAVLRLACEGRTKALHFISSTGVWAGRFPVAEDDALDFVGGLENGYVQTKWVAEHLVRQAAGRGLPVTIHRPPRVTGDTRSGSANLDDFVARVIKGCAQLGAAPEGHFFDLMSPVDIVARAVVAIMKSPEAFSRQRFHLVPTQLMTWRTILDFMPTVGIPLVSLPYGRWRERLIAHCQHNDNALKPLLPLFRASDDGGFAEIAADVDLASLPEVPCGNTRAILDPAGITIPAVDASLLQVYFQHFFDIGFLALPGKAAN